MINVILSPTILLGFCFIVGFLIFFYIKSINYDLARDTDLFFSTLALIYSLIIFLHGWRLDPILFFSQVLLLIILFGLVWENIRLRGIILYKKKQNKS